MVALEETFHDDLPVRGDLFFAAAEQPVTRRNSGGNGVHRAGDSRGLLGDEHEAVALDGRDRHQAARVLVEAREAVLVRHVPQSTVESVGPAVIAAHEGLLAAGALGELRAAMAAGVAEGAHPPVAPRTARSGVPAASRATYDPASGRRRTGRRASDIGATPCISAANRSSAT